MSSTNNVFYILKDHLGSASVTLDSSGTSIAEARYYPFGETRVSSGTIPTDKRFQSQRDVGLGLMQFGARFYSVYLNRWIQPDTDVPARQGVPELNRYAFAYNNPLKYIDPTGHMAICGVACEEGTAVTTATGQVVTYSTPVVWKPSYNPVDYGVTFVGDWTPVDKAIAMQEIGTIGERLADNARCFTCEDDVRVPPPNDVFKQVFGDITIGLSSTGGLGCERTGTGFACGAGTRGRLREYYNKGLVTHELGHVFNARVANNDMFTPYNFLNSPGVRILDDLGNHVTGRNPDFQRTDLGYQISDDPTGFGRPFQQHSLAMGGGNTPGEDFADMFMNWFFDSFDYSPVANGAGYARNHWMTMNMTEWITNASLP